MKLENKAILHIGSAEQHLSKLEANGPAWLKAARRQGWAQFNQEGIPTVKQEEWKYLSLTALTSRAFSVAQPAQSPAFVDNYRDAKDINIVLINGHWSRELSNADRLPK